MRRSAAFAFVLTLAAVSAAASPWKIEKEETLDVENGVAHDIRWASDTQIFIAEGVNGVSVRRVDTPRVVESYAIPPAKKGGFFFASRMAASASYVVAASPLNAYTWRARKAGAAVHPAVPFGMMIDVDVHGDKIAMLGGDTNDTGGTPQGIVSLASLNRNAEDRRILMEGPTGKKGQELVRCHFLEPGAVRFLSDASLVIAPGLTSGVFQFDKDGKLMRTWQTDTLNVLDDCNVDHAQMVEMAADFAKRTEYVNRFTTVEDILPFEDTPALLLRTVRNNATTWEIAYLNANGKITRAPLPFRSTSPRAHLRGDVRNNRIALLLFDYELPGNPPLPPKFFLARR